MQWTKIYELPKDVIPTTVYDDLIGLFIVAGIIVSIILEYRKNKRKKISNAVFIVAAFLFGIGLLYDLIGVIPNNGKSEIEPFSKAYYAGQYEITQGIPDYVETTKSGVEFSLNGMTFFFYGGNMIPPRSEIKVYFVEMNDGLDWKYVVRIDAKQ